MQSSAREQYLTTQVMTATPQKLQLMLIEAAIRSARHAQEQWQARQHEQACESLIHAQEIVGQLLAALDAEADANLVKRVAAVYLFVFRSLMEANYHRDQKKLDDALRILEIERETWRKVAQPAGDQADARELLASPVTGEGPRMGAGCQEPAAQDRLPSPALGEGPGVRTSGFSLEA
jgi:flagellar protein FliS